MPPAASIFIIIDVPERGRPDTMVTGWVGAGALWSPRVLLNIFLMQFVYST